ncbi:MAG: XylR family transcriptional regulator [Chthoniobacteraceae bacterium]|nr:XylR family transcriptional regulator [Chthoniobacteraceae bacterium]
MPAAKSKIPPPSRVRRVAVLVDTSTDWGRRIITGIVSYVREHVKWQLFIEPAGLEESLELPAGWHGDGVIARVSTPRIAAHLRARGLPVVNISSVQIPGPEFPRVANDGRLVAKMAAEYFLDRGFRHFGYISPLGFPLVAQQRGAFATAVENAGGTCAVYSLKTHHGAQTVDWNLNIERLGEWLQSLPKPVALLTWSGGREVIYACRRTGLSVPEEVALMSGSDDFMCEISQVPISAVRAAGERIGYEAAAQLDALLRGARVPEKSIYIPPSGSSPGNRPTPWPSPIAP